MPAAPCYHSRAVRPAIWLSFALAATLVVGEWLYAIVLRPRPFWIWQGDVEHTFFFSALQLAGGRLPTLHHPGMPANLIGAAVVWLSGAGLPDMQRFLNATYVVLILATVASLALVAAVMLPPRTPVWLGAALLVSPFAHLAVVTHLWYWGAHSLILPFGLLALCGLWVALPPAGGSPAAPAGWPRTAMRVSTLTFLSGVGCGLAGSVYLWAAAIGIGGAVAHAWAALDGAAAPTYSRQGLASFQRILVPVWLLLTVWLAAVCLALTGRLASLRFLLAVGTLMAGLAALAVVLVAAGRRDRWGTLVAREAEYLVGFGSGWSAGMLFAIADQQVVLRIVGRALLRPAYQSGSSSVLLANAAFLWAQAFCWTVLAVGVTVAILVTMWRVFQRWDGTTGARGQTLALGAGLLAMIVVAAFMGLRESDPVGREIEVGFTLRYTLPVAVMVTTGLAWLWSVWTNGQGVPASGRAIWMWRATAAWIFVAVAVATSQGATQRERLLAAGFAEQAVIDGQARVFAMRAGRPAHLVLGPTSDPVWALWNGNRYVSDQYAGALRALYPDRTPVDATGDQWAARCTRPAGSEGADLLVLREGDLASAAGGDGARALRCVESWGLARRYADGLHWPLVIVELE